MRRDFFVIFFIFILSVFAAACGGGATPTNQSSGNTVKENSNNPLAVKTPTPEATTNNAPTLTPVFKAYCDAWVKNDEAALRKIYSSETIKTFEAQMKEEKAKNLIKFLEDTDKVSGTPCEVTNEKINGDTAEGRIRSNLYPNGIPIVFVKENGEWKITNKSSAVDSVKSSNSNSNASK